MKGGTEMKQHWNKLRQWQQCALIVSVGFVGVSQISMTIYIEYQFARVIIGMAGFVENLKVVIAGLPPGGIFLALSILVSPLILWAIFWRNRPRTRAPTIVIQKVNVPTAMETFTEAQGTATEPLRYSIILRILETIKGKSPTFWEESK
jgi:hypothetical protein